MPATTDEPTTPRASVWLDPGQINSMRAACYECSPPYLQRRNDAIVQTLADTGLRVGELVQLNVGMLRDNNSALYLPSQIQKDYPTENSPPPVTMDLAEETTDILKTFLDNRWKDSDSLLPSRKADRMTTQGVRYVVQNAAETADIQPYRIDGTLGNPDDVTPHAIRHSLAYRMLHHEEGNTLYDVRNRLRHRSIQTTERVYDHFRRI